MHLIEPLRHLDHLPCSRLAEGPSWDGETATLTWVDIVGRFVHRYEPATDAVATHQFEASVGFCIVGRHARLVAGVGPSIRDFAFGQPGTRVLASPTMHEGNRFNDGKCDPRGRLWAGTMHADARRDREPTGALYRWRVGAMEVVEAPVSLSNGLGWSPAGDTMYFADTHAGTVWAYDYDLATGGVSGRRPFAVVPIEDGVPDGVAVNVAGQVVVAIWRGARLDVFAPDGRRDGTIPVPVRNPTSCAFGGADLRTLFVTTMPSDNEDDPRSGSVFAAAVDVPGLPAARMDPAL